METENKISKLGVAGLIGLVASILTIVGFTTGKDGPEFFSTPQPVQTPVFYTPTPSPEITPTTKLESGEWKEVEEPSPGPNDMAGYSDIQAPQSTSWLAARETRYAYAPHGAAVYIYKGPSLGRDEYRMFL